MRTLPNLSQVNTDQQDKGLAANVTIDRDTASRLGIAAAEIDVLYDAFGQRQVSTIYKPLNQYHVVMEVAPDFSRVRTRCENTLRASSTKAVWSRSRLRALWPANTSLAVNHQGQWPAVTLSFNLAPGVSLGEATTAIEKAERSISFPATIHASFQGTARPSRIRCDQAILILRRFWRFISCWGFSTRAISIPITILSTLPSAGVGAMLAADITHNELNVIGLIGIILLIGIVKKNAIMMIDFALYAERKHGKSPTDAIHEACLLRFRPIMMTTMAALLGGLPLALGTGTGSELRRPLGITIVGGLIVSQMLTLFTTPVVYIYIDRVRLWLSREPERVAYNHDLQRRRVRRRATR